MCGLFGDVMDVPVEIVAELPLAETAVLAIATLEPGKVTFQTIG